MDAATDTTLIADAYGPICAALADALAPTPVLSVSQWADRYRRLPSKGASEPGQWRTARVPFIRELMDCLSPHHPARRVVFQKSTQVAGTEAGNNWIGYIIHRLRIPAMVVQPTIDLAERWSKQRLAAMIEETPVLRGMIAPARSRDSGNTTLLKEWPGGVLIISGANSGSSLRSMPAKYLFADEVDAYPVDLDGEGDPLTLAEARTSTFPDRKVFLCSTPTIESLSVIAKEYAASDQRRYYVPCPHCDELQPLVWEQLHWSAGDPQSARYVCRECGTEIVEANKERMLAAGEWVAERPDQAATAAGFHINALYTPAGLGLSWGELAALYERVRNDPVRIKSFTNTKLGICTSDPEERIDWEELQHRAEPYALRSVPPGCLVITAGVDVQADRWAVLLLGHGEGGQEWVLDWVEIDGDPSDPQAWRRIDAYLTDPLTNRHGVPMRPQSVCVDAGYLQHDVLAYTRTREPRGIHGIKGASTYGKPIIGHATKVDINWRGSTIRNGAKLWVVGEDTAKTRLLHLLTHDRKAVAASERRLHFSSDLDESFYTMFAAEVWDPNKRRWVKVRNRNEALDCYCYATAAAHHPRLRLNRWGAAQWQRQRDLMEPQIADLFAPTAQPPATVPDTNNPPPATPPKRQEHPPWIAIKDDWMKR